MLSTEARRALTLLLKSVNATAVHAQAVDLRTVPASKRDTVKEAREVLANLGEDLAALLVEAEATAA